MLSSELPGGIFRPGPEYADGIAPEGGIELVHDLPVTPQDDEMRSGV